MEYCPAIQTLVDEHTVITSVLDALETAVARVTQDEPVPPAFFARACDFFAGFADRCHHAKEETHLFPRLEQRGIPREYGPIGCMLHEHEEGRAHVRALRAAAERVAAGDRTALGSLVQEARAYAELLRQHILKENQVLFVMAENNLTDADKAELEQVFGRVEREELSPEAHTRFVALARELRAAVGLGD